MGAGMFPAFPAVAKTTEKEQPRQFGDFRVLS